MATPCRECTVELPAAKIDFSTWRICPQHDNQSSRPPKNADTIWVGAGGSYRAKARIAGKVIAISRDSRTAHLVEPAFSVFQIPNPELTTRMSLFGSQRD